MIAEVTGAKTLPLDEVEYTYPTMKIRTLKIWPEDRYVRPWPYPYYPYLYRYPYHPFYPFWWDPRSEEHTSELQSRLHLVCRLLLEKKKKACRALTVAGVRAR